MGGTRVLTKPYVPTLVLVTVAGAAERRRLQIERDSYARRLGAEAKFRGLLEAAPDAIVGVGRDGLISLVNAQAEQLFGYTRDELEGRPVEVLVPDAAKAVHPTRRSGYFASPTPRPRARGCSWPAAARTARSSRRRSRCRPSRRRRACSSPPPYGM